MCGLGTLLGDGFDAANAELRQHGKRHEHQAGYQQLRGMDAALLHDRGRGGSAVQTPADAAKNPFCSSAPHFIAGPNCGLTSAPICATPRRCWPWEICMWAVLVRGGTRKAGFAGAWMTLTRAGRCPIPTIWSGWQLARRSSPTWNNSALM